MNGIMRIAVAAGALALAACAGQERISSGVTVFDVAVGTWDWARGDSTCLGNRHSIRFSADKREMIVTFLEPVDDETGQREFVYRVLDAGPTIHPELTHVIRAAMVGETRTTDAGELVIWDLVLATSNRYHWHRTDWPDLSVTNAVIRCDGSRALEAWDRPGES